LVSRNEQADPSVIIARLKREVAELKAELLMLKGGEGVKESLTAEDLDRCNKMVEDFVEAQDPMK
jgi:kinesin family member 6/9